MLLVQGKGAFYSGLGNSSLPHALSGYALALNEIELRWLKEV